MPYASGDIHLLFDTMVETGASDLHITVGRPPVLRLKGGLKVVSSTGRRKVSSTAGA